MKKKGLTCTGGPSDTRSDVALEAGRARAGGKAPAALPAPASSLTLLGSTFSPTLGRIAFETNHASNNVFAETLLRTLGKELRQSACYDSSYVALNDVMKDLKVDVTRGVKVQDGSGLSRQNYVSADFLCRFLDAMMDSPAYGTYLASLPSPGGNGTLQYNMKGQPAALRERIKVKSGSMNGVRCYSGYILPAGYSPATSEELRSRIIVFSILTNNCTSPTWKVRPLLDRIMVTLASEN